MINERNNEYVILHEVDEPFIDIDFESEDNTSEYSLKHGANKLAMIINF